ncbi:hypothetical protein Cpin_4290 [Chitinophaga pinensis DSM 2588]|uniref:Uncharacterized protein n=1 Tax=Chitinophaga pinensis (strain ATCC 43595 / DSM 2588 / LMG 13176 / NBRC 15968 / NCIMB 11800 / UQM 2034) TaxID=485918 RepID=A0A979G6G2_CHIPD|nr:hypothetical protein Cpin_4290 [Chitinophaga pinensis DSM 2588]
MYHNLAADVTATFSYGVNYRSINKGDKTISESDDRITLYNGSSDTQIITLIRREQLRPKMWVITAGTGRFVPITIGSVLGQTELVFNLYSDAVNFLSRLQRQTPTAANVLMIGSHRVVMPGDFSTLNAMTIIPN